MHTPHKEAPMGYMGQQRLWSIRLVRLARPLITFGKSTTTFEIRKT